MRRYVSYLSLAILLVVGVVWAVTMYIQPILPPVFNKGLFLFFVVLSAVVAFIANIKEILECLLNIANSDALLSQQVSLKRSGGGSSVMHNLPQPDYEDFIGRQSELSQLHRLLRPYPESRHFVISVDGVGGVGKSALALEVANNYLYNVKSLREKERFDAIVWSSAKPSFLTSDGPLPRSQAFHTIDDIYTSISVALDRSDILRAPAAQQGELVRRALTQQRTLLIIDNLDTADDEAIKAFIREVPAPTKVVVTTRHRLYPAFPLRLNGMDLVDALHLIGSESKRRAVSITNDQSQRLYARTGGVPLAIVWSIAQAARGYGIENVLARLGQPTSDVARYCFRGAVEMIADTPSYRLLLALSMFATDASRGALGYIAALSELDLDEGLVILEELSLVNKYGERFMMLPLTLAYAQSQLAEDSQLEVELRNRWVHYFLTFLDKQGQGYENLAKVRVEMQNVAEAIGWCLGAGRLTEFIRFLDKMNFYFWATGSWNLWNRYLTVGPRIAASLNEDLLQASFLGWLASMKYYQDSLCEAEEFIQQAIRIYRVHDDAGELALSLRRLASIKAKQGDCKGARSDLEEGLILAQEVHNTRYIARIQRQLAKLDIVDGDLDAAQTRLEEARVLRERETRLSSGQAYTYRLLGQVAYLQRNYDSSYRYYQTGLDIGKVLGTQHDIAEAKLGLARLELVARNNQTARKLVQEAVAVLEKLGMRGELREAKDLLARIERRMCRKKGTAK